MIMIMIDGSEEAIKGSRARQQPFRSESTCTEWRQGIEV